MSLKDCYLEFKDCPKNTIREYYRQFKSISKNMSSVSVNIQQELIKIIKDYKQPASARVQAIREYNNLSQDKEVLGEDPYLKFLESKNLKTKTIIDSS